MTALPGISRGTGSVARIGAGLLVVATLAGGFSSSRITDRATKAMAELHANVAAVASSVAVSAAEATAVPVGLRSNWMKGIEMLCDAGTITAPTLEGFGTETVFRCTVDSETTATWWTSEAGRTALGAPLTFFLLDAPVGALSPAAKRFFDAVLDEGSGATAWSWWQTGPGASDAHGIYDTFIGDLELVGHPSGADADGSLGAQLEVRTFTGP